MYPSDPGVTRRRLLGGAAALGAGALLGITATGSPFGRGDRTVSLWHLFRGGDGGRLAVMLEDYAEASTGIEVQPLTLTWGPPYSTKLALAAAGDRPPDVAAFHASRLGAYAPQGLLTELDPQRLADHPLVLSYNTELAERAGLMDGARLKELRGEDEVLDAFAAMKEATGGMGVSFEVRGVMLWRIWTTFYAQLDGGPMFTPDGQQLTMDDEKAERAVAFMTEMTRGREVAPDNLDSQASVANSGARSEERLDSALAFVAGTLERSLTWAEGGHIPAWQPVVDSRAYATLEPQSHYAVAAERATTGPSVWFGGAGSELENETYAAFQGSLTGATDPAGAVRQFRRAIEDFLDKPSPVVA